MFSLNFKKDWRMNKSVFISFFAIALIIFVVNAGFYGILKFGNFNAKAFEILRGIWLLIYSLSNTVGLVLVIVLMYFILKKDLGKNKIQYSIFTPQPLWAWLLPKVLFVFIIQGLFALISLGYTYFYFDIVKTMPGVGQIDFDIWSQITLFLTSTFNFGFFAMMTLCMALYYSFRKKGIAWTLIVVSVLVYFLGFLSHTIYQLIYDITPTGVEIPEMVIPYVIKNIIGLIYIFISLHLYDKKIEY